MTTYTIDSKKFGTSTYSPPSTIYVCSVSHDTSVQKPYSYKQASTNARWIDAMHKELSDLESNNTWTIVNFPPSKKVVGHKWLYKVKHLSDGNIDKFKARLVVKGYTQIEGEDYHNTFAIKQRKCCQAPCLRPYSTYTQLVTSTSMTSTILATIFKVYTVDSKY